MTPDIFAEWLRRQGHKVLQTPSSYWVEAGPRVFQAFPYHWIISPHQEEIAKLLKDQKAIAIRYSTPMNSETGCISYHVVYEHREYELKDLPKKARYDVRKGLSIASVEPISFTQLATKGWKLRQETLIRQGRQKTDTEASWRGLCFSAESLPGFEAWGTFVGGKLVAALIAFSCDEYFSILYHQSLTECLSFGINNALTYIVTADVMNRPEPKYLFYGLHSLDAPSSVDRFKFRMGYVAKPVLQRVEFNALIRPFVNRASCSMLRVGKIISNNAALSKAEGMSRFYLQGKMPLSRQAKPRALEDLLSL